MMINDEQLTKFQEIYKNRFGKELSKQEAYDSAIKLVNLAHAIYFPEDYETPVRDEK